MRFNLPNVGKQLRLRRLIDQESGAIIAVPMDHGFTLGPIKGVDRISTTAEKVYQGGASAVIIHKGNVPRLVNIPNLKGIMIHISASVSLSPHSAQKVLTASVDEVARLGADGVSVHVNIGATGDKEMISDLGMVADDANALGLPLLAMMYARDDEGNDNTSAEALAHIARIAQEAGADIVKINATEGGKGFDEVTQGIDIPIVIAGGAKSDDFQGFLKTVESCILQGASGISIGRNIFQADDPTKATSKVVEVVRKAMKERA